MSSSIFRRLPSLGSVLSLALLAASACTSKKYEFSDIKALQNPSPASADYSFQGTAQTKIRLGDRDHADSVFKDVFGSGTLVTGTTTVDDILKVQVHGYISYFGGACDPGYVETTWMGAKSYAAGELVRATEHGAASDAFYRALNGHTSSNIAAGAGYCAGMNAVTCKKKNFSTDLAAGNWIKTQTQGCYRRTESLTPMISGPAPAREALRVQLCETLTGTDSTLAVAISNVGGDATSAPGATQIAAVWELFHFGDEIAPEISTALQKVVDTTATALQSEATVPSASEITQEQWRFLFLTVCRSPTWSIL
jgi:hypothetical protein